ncbi:hypothetical protein HU200_056930 [Digitaria exilis]|uniref:Uncharacterized protein n=1 Tax=Digitaria exilis TaxID=1010633 RepID=A0A835AI61_9POAL|nr:hypothetical protein HU200_056930 [Digitaria exilis]
MAGLVAGTTFGSLWGIGALVEEEVALAGKGIPAVEEQGTVAGVVDEVVLFYHLFGVIRLYVFCDIQCKMSCLICFRGNQAYAKGQLAEAEECYTHGIDSCPPNEASRKTLMLCYSNRAATRMSLGKMREALSDCRKATDIDSSFLKAQVRAAK